jgi:hypothetical protein
MAISTPQLNCTGELTAETFIAGGKSVLISASTVVMNWSLGNVFLLTPASSCTVTPANGTDGQVARLVITTTGTTSRTITFGTPSKSTGTLATGTTAGKKFVVTFVFDGTNYIECSRTTAM